MTPLPTGTSCESRACSFGTSLLGPSAAALTASEHACVAARATADSKLPPSTTPGARADGPCASSKTMGGKGQLAARYPFDIETTGPCACMLTWTVAGGRICIQSQRLPALMGPAHAAQNNGGDGQLTARHSVTFKPQAPVHAHLGSCRWSYGRGEGTDACPAPPAPNIIRPAYRQQPSRRPSSARQRPAAGTAVSVHQGHGCVCCHAKHDVAALYTVICVAPTSLRGRHRGWTV
jgi:hypothetical protein